MKYTALLTILIVIFGINLAAQPNDAYRVERMVGAGAKKFGEKNILTFHVFDGDEIKYTLHKELDYDIPFPAVKVFDNGRSVLINAFDATLTFYDDQGIERLKSHIIKETDVEYERSVYSAVSGDFLVIAVNPSNTENLTVRLYGSKGEFIRDFRVAGKHINGISYSSRQNLIAVSTYSWQNDNLDKTTLFISTKDDQESAIQADFSTGYFIDSQNLFLGYSNKNCFVYSLTDKSIDFSKSVSADDMILSARIMDKEIVVVEAKIPFLDNGKWYYLKPALLRYTKNGELINKNIIESPPFAEFNLYKTNSSLIFQTEHKSVKIK